MVLRFFAMVVTALIALATYLYVYLGFYKPVEISIEERGPFHLLYKEHTGAYHQIVPTIQAVEAWALQQNVTCKKTFGEYLDDPAAIDQDRLRSRGGCVLPSPLSGIDSQFKSEERPQRRYVVARFKGSPSIGPFKVYPKVEEFLQTQRLKSAGPVVEMYQVDGSLMTTEFLFPVE